MGLIAIAWETKQNVLVNMVYLTGTVISSEYTEDSERLLLMNALQYIEVAKTLKGRLIPFGEPPKGENKQSVCFKVIFKNKIDCERFLKAIKE